MQVQESSAKHLKMRLFGFSAVFIIIVAIASIWGVTQSNTSKSAYAAGSTGCANPPFLPPVNNLVIGRVDLNIIKDKTTKHDIIEANMHLFYIATANAKKPIAFHIHLNSATGPVAYTGSVSTDAHGWILAQHVKMTATTNAPSDLKTFPNNGTWILNFHDTTLPHKDGTPPVAVGHAPINDIENGGKTAIATGFWQ